MAGQLIAFSIDVTLGAGAANEVLQVKAPSNIRGRLRKLVVSGQAAAGGTDAVTQGRLTLSSANFGTFTGTVTKTKLNAANAETIQSTFSGGADGTGGSTRPTSPTAIGVGFSVSPQSAFNVTAILPEGGLDVPGGYAVNVELTNSGTPTHRVSGVWEE